MTITPIQQRLTFEQFLDRYPEDGRHELINGEIVRILVTRRHENVADLVEDTMRDEVKRLKLNYRVSNRVVLAT